MLVAQRHGADQEPAIFPVNAAQTHFILVRFPSSHAHKPLFHDPWKVFGMNCARRLFKCLLQREARIFHPTLIDEINGAVRQNAPGHRGNCVDHKPKMIVASPQIIFRPLAHSDFVSQLIDGSLELDGAFVNQCL